MWYEILSQRKFNGYKFLRQKPIANYILDFYCSELLLAVELDGDTHTEQIEYDERRTQELAKIGIKVVRYTNKEVMENLEGVYEDLVEKINEREKNPPHPPCQGGK